MIVPRMPLLPLVGTVADGVGVGDEVVGVELGVGAALVDGGEVCLVFVGAAEEGWLPGLDDFPDFPAPGV
jgi:hypothetical protein